MRRCRQWLKVVLVAMMFMLGVVAVATVMPSLRLFLGRRSAHLNEAIVLGWNRSVCRILNVRLRVAGELDPNAQLLVANHVSWLDIIALGSQFPCLFVAKGDVAQWPVIGYLAKGIDTLFVKRGDAEQTSATSELMVWRLRQGKRLMLFPEGTTTRGERVLRFHGKLFQPAQLACVSVQAIALRYNGEGAQFAPFIGEDEFLPHLLKIIKLESIELNLHYCPALPAGLDRSEMAAASHLQIAEAIDPAWAHGRSRGQRRIMRY